MTNISQSLSRIMADKAGVDMMWRNYVTVTLCMRSICYVSFTK